MGVAPQPLDAALARAAELGRIPAERRDVFHELVKPCVEYLCLQAKAGESTNMETFLAGRRLFEEIADLANELRCRLERVEDHASVVAEMLGSALEEHGGSVAEFVRLVRAVAARAGAATFSKGRPARHTWLRYLVEQLEFGALACGGDFTISKDREGGTIVEALEILRPHLPRGVLKVPGTHPVSTYNRILIEMRAEAAFLVEIGWMDAAGRYQWRAPAPALIRRKPAWLSTSTYEALVAACASK